MCNLLFCRLAKILFMRFLNFILFTFYFTFSQGCHSQTATDSVAIKSNEFVFPKVNDFINDTENILKTHEKIILNKILENFERNSNVTITIVTTSSIYPYEDIFKYSLDMADSLTSDKHSATEVLIVLSQSLRQIQIQNSDSIRNLLTDSETKNIIDTFIIPEFKKGNYFKGLKRGISEIKKELR